MRRIGWGLVAALLFAVSAPAAASAAAPKAAAAPAAAVTKDARDKGMAAAPALVSAGGLTCDVADARLIGEGSDPKTRTKQTLYELACKNNEGMLVMKKVDAVTAFSCVQADQPGPDGKPSTTQCLLPGNLDPKAQLVPYIQKSGLTCTPDKARSIGQNATNVFFEVSCSDRPGGFIVETSAPMDPAKPVVANPCIMVPEGGNISCTLTDRAAQLAVVDKLNAAANKNCTIKEGGRGFLAATQNGKLYYEVACQDGKGYLLAQNPNGSLDQAIPCAEADPYFGGCKLTDARQAKTEQAGLYTQLAKKAGFNCDVAGYAPLPGSQMAQGAEVVELKCSNRPDGAIALFPSNASEQAGVYNCAVSELLGYRCVLTKAAAAYPALTDNLKAVGKSSCTVSEARSVGVSASDKKAFVEVGCSDGLQGYMLQYTFTPPAPLKPETAIICAQAGTISGGCTLPGNNKKS